MCDTLRAQLTEATFALAKLRDCDWIITLPDRMDKVREIAREALEEIQRLKEEK